MKTIALIPARKGSVRLPNKNRMKLAGQPLIEWTIKFAKKLKFIDDIIVSTNDKRIINYIKKYRGIKIFVRSDNLSRAKTKTEDVIFDVVKKYETRFKKINTILLLQPTSPFRSIKKVHFAYKKYNYYNKLNSIISVSKTSNPAKKFYKIKKNKLVNLNKNENNKSKYQMNGNFYFISPVFLKKYKSFFHENNTCPVILNSKPHSIDIDTKKDFKMAERILIR
tara:strand:+ start:1115 stop:1783 length:669 start_codon:yes stop_codon:yes gene_type:complete